MNMFKRGELKFRSLPRYVISTIRSIGYEYLDGRRSFSKTSSLSRRRNGISANSYNELRKLILNTPLPTDILQCSPTKEFSVNGIDFPLAASSYYILTVVNECSALVLFSKDSELYRIDLSDVLVLIHDLCWSSKLNMFLMAGYSLYTLSPRTCTLSTIDGVHLARGEWIVSITSSHTSIYLLYSSRSLRIECRPLLLPHSIDKQWHRAKFLHRNDFLAQCIRMNEWNILAMTIKSNSSEWRIDLFDATTLRRLHQGFSLGESVLGMRTCLIMSYNRSWIVINNCSTRKRVVLLNEHGHFHAETYIDDSYGPFNLCLIGNEWIGMNVKDKLRLYKI